MRRIPATPAALTLLATGLLGVWAWKATTPEKPAAVVVTAPPVRPAPALDLLATRPGPEDARRELRDFRSSLAAMPKDEAVALIRSILDRGEDRPTGLAFEIAGDSSLTGWPTLRTFLLDALLAIDPAAAATISRDILSKPTTADEWALALRNVARSGNDAAYLRAKTEQLILHPAWQADPSIGYLNAFDVLVHIGSTESTPLLSSLIQRKDRKDLAHAGFLTLDRLVQRQPVDELTRLAADTALQQSRPEMVAQQFARADLRDPEQQSLVKAWLLDPARQPAELRAFAGVYPNNNRFVSNNLLTRESAPSGDDLAAHDRAALQVLVAWQQDPSFAPVADHLAGMVSRLGGFVGLRSGLPPPP
jgi:hypothetical protein